MFNLQENPEISNSKDSSCSLDLQYEICSQFMRHTSDELLRREVELIQQTSKFIERINDNLMLKDVSTTQESFTLDTLPDEEDCFSQPSRSRLLLRKSQSNVTLRRSESGFTDALSEVRRKCSQKTVSLLTNMMNETKRTRQKMLGSDRLQKELTKVENKYQIKQQEHFILKKKLKDLEETSKSVDQEMTALKLKLKEAKGQIHSDWLRGSRASEVTNESSHHEKMKKYLEEKEMQIARKQKELKGIQGKIELAIESPVDEGCQKCCNLVKKIKESILKYRFFLEEEVSMAEALYGNFKTILT